jgi:hypothetical protein
VAALIRDKPTQKWSKKKMKIPYKREGLRIWERQGSALLLSLNAPTSTKIRLCSCMTAMTGFFCLLLQHKLGSQPVAHKCLGVKNLLKLNEN